MNSIIAPLAQECPAAQGIGIGLAELPLRVDAWVQGLQMDTTPDDTAVLLRLLEIGFLPGEPVRLIGRAFPAGDPLAVRIGSSTFALRLCEANLVRVSTTPPLDVPEGAIA